MAISESDLSGVPLRRYPVQERSRDKVLRALAAANELVQCEGVDSLTLPRVAERAGVSVGALHQYLPDRVAIATALVARYHARLEQSLDDVIAEVPRGVVVDPIAEVVSRIAAIYRQESTTRHLREVVLVQQDASWTHKHRMVEKVRILLAVTGAIEATPTVARTIFTAADALMHEAFANQDTDSDGLVNELEDLLRAYLAHHSPS